MGAVLLWKMGARSGETPIRLQVSRIGRRPECDLSLDAPGLPEHALSLWYEDGKYVLNNVSDRAFHLEGAALEPQESLEWSSGSVLSLSDGVTITLKIRGDSAPAAGSEAGGPSTSAPELAEDESLEDAARAETQGNEDEIPAWLTSFRYEYVVILLCCLVIPLLLASGPTGDQRAEKRRIAELESKLTQQLSEENTDPRILEIRTLMARGASDEARGEDAAAALEYGEAKNIVLRMQLEGGYDEQLLTDLADVIKSHLE